jgi:SEC-C motif domain protein
MALDLCPCSSGGAYRDCCGPYHRGERLAPTCEALMRSRYAAFARKQLDYLVATSHPDLIAEHEGEAAMRRGLRESCEAHSYPGLTVHEHHEDGDHGQVLFTARIFRKGQDVSFSERSDFVREQGRWLYLSGEMSAPLRS